MNPAELDFIFEEGDAPGKRRILAGALHLFANRGLEGTSVRDIAAAARTTNPALYKHYTGKDALALQLFVSCYREMWTRLDTAVAARSGFEPKLGAFVNQFLAFYDAHPEAVLFISENIDAFWPRVPASMAGRSISNLARGLIEEGLEEGAVKPGIAMEVRVLGIVGQLFQVGRMIFLNLMEGPGSRWEADLRRQILQMLR